MDIFSWLAGWIPNPATLYRKIRYRGRIRLELGWTGAGMIVFDGPNKFWRTLLMIVTSSRDEDYVVARGAVEVLVPGARNWQQVWALGEAVNLPTTVPKNFEKSYKIDGEGLAKRIRQTVPSTDVVSIRVRAEDYHRVTLTTEPLQLSVSELERTESH